MSKMNHARITLKQRVASQGQEPRSNNITAPVQSWIPLTFGRHQGSTLPKVLHEDPGYVVNYLYEKMFDVLLKPDPTLSELRLAHQLEVLQVRAERILPPKEFRGTHDFAVWLDSTGRYSETYLARIGSKPKASVPTQAKLGLCSAVFAVSMPLHFADPSEGLRRATGCMIRLFGHVGAGLELQFDADQFFSDRSNFDLSGVKSHKSLAMTDGDISALRQKYFNRRAA